MTHGFGSEAEYSSKIPPGYVLTPKQLPTRELIAEATALIEKAEITTTPKTVVVFDTSHPA